MSNPKDIDEIYNFIKKYKKNQVAFMNCTSEYPPSFNDINLGFIQVMKNKYKDFIIGHSDHTNTIETSIAAVSLGAKIIEKHIYLGNKNFGPDRDVSISTNQLKNLVIFNDFTNEIKKTKEMNKIIKKFEITNSLIILDKKSKDKIFKATRNIPSVKVTDVNHFSAFDVVKFKKVVFTESSVKELEKRYS